MSFVIFETSVTQSTVRLSNTFRFVGLALSVLLSTLFSNIPHFLSSDDIQARFQRLNQQFAKPITEVYLMFYQVATPVFLLH